MESRAQRILLVVVVCAVLGVGVLYFTRGPQQQQPAVASAPTPGARLEPSAPQLAASAIPTHTQGGPAPVAVRRTLKDRERRDAMRRRIYAAFGEQPPERPKPSAQPRKAASPAAQPSAPRGSLGKQYIQDRIREDFVPLAKECYEAALERDPDLGGKLKVKFEIVGDESVGGIVESAELSEDSEIQDEEFMYCMRESMLSMSFEPPKGGGSVSVTYPFIFASGDE